MDQAVSHRLDRLERENRFFKAVGLVALAVIAAVVLMGQGTGSKVAKVIEAEKFVLRDGNGKERGLLSITNEVVVFSLSDKAGRVRHKLSVEPNGATNFLLGDRDGDPRVQLIVLPDGQPGLWLYGKKSKILAKLSEGVLDLRHENQNSRVTMIILHDGSPHMALFDKAGKAIWIAP